MITGVTAGRITTASHQATRQLTQTGGQIVFEDPRIRSWITAHATSFQQLGQVTGLSATLSATGTLVAGTTYWYTVCGISGTNQSIPSYNENSALTVNPSYRSIVLTWSGVAHATAYAIYRRTGTDYRVSGLLGSANVTSYTDSAA